MNEHDALLRLAHGALSPRRVEKLIDRYGSARSAVAAVVAGRTTVKSPKELITVPVRTRRTDLADMGCSWHVVDATGSLSRLTPYPDHPMWLFARGDLDCLNQPTLSIVGSRASTTYGLELAYAYGRVAATAGWTVVSGLARGVDGAAHRGALTVEGGCVGVLGSGIDVVYPREHALLYDEVAESGCLLSEYPPGTRPDAWRFPTRNRIIAGLSDVVLVVEASEKGGALITARIALDYGVPVYAVPGDIDRVTSRGANALIRDGAFPIFGAPDLADVLSLLEPVVRAR